MFKAFQSGVLAVLCGMVLAGCATTPARDYTADIDSLNAKISGLQAQLSEKDAEIARLQNQMREEEIARNQAEMERKAIAEKLDAALAAQAEKKTVTPEPASDLK